MSVDHIVSLVAQTIKCLPIMRQTRVPWIRKIPWRRKCKPTAVLLPGKSHGWRSLVGYSPWGRKESDTTERLHFTPFTHFILYRWNRKWQPTLCSCMENPMDRGAWWAMVHGVSESQTRLSTCAHTHTHTHTMENNQISIVQETKFPGENNCKE